MEPHHEETVRRLVEHVRADPQVQALVLGGSLAHGFARPDSDVDVTLVVSSEEYRRRTEAGALHWNDFTIPTYEGGYIDGKYVDLAFLRLVAERGSDPARYAYADARVLFSRVAGLDELLTEIARFPEHEREPRTASFAAQLLAWRWYYGESVAKDSRYLEVLALHKLVLFTCRLVLTANRMLYPYHKWVLRLTASAPDRPADLMERIDDVLSAPPFARVDAHVRDLLAYYGIDHDAANASWPTLFMQDTELSWLGGTPPVDDR